jgi:hypothetical protein
VSLCRPGARNVPYQQPGGGDTPGVAAAPVAFAGAIVPGGLRYIVVLSAQAGVFGVGTTAKVGSMLVPPSCATTGCIVPGGASAGSSGVESGNAAPLVGAPPGVELHIEVEELPSGVIGAVFPVVVATVGVGIVPNGEIVAIAAVSVNVDGFVEAVPGIDVDIHGTDDGTGTAVKEGGGRAGSAGGRGAGMIDSGRKLANDVPGCWENVNGATAVPVVGVK